MTQVNFSVIECNLSRSAEGGNHTALEMLDLFHFFRTKEEYTMAWH